MIPPLIRDKEEQKKRSMIGIGRFKSLKVIHMIIFLHWYSAAEAANSSRHIVVGAVPTSAEVEFLIEWRPTFEGFLNEEVGKHFIQPVSFSLVVLNLSSAFDAISEGTIDFIFANPSLYSCLDPEFSGPYSPHYLSEERSLI